MSSQDLPYLHALAALRPMVSAVKLRSLIQKCDGIRNAWNVSTEDLAQASWNSNQQRAYFDHKKCWDIERKYEELQRSDITILPIQDPSIPNRLREIHSPPVALYVRGMLPEATSVWIAVVGSRKATSYGLTVTRTITDQLATRNIPIVSGLAYGIDTEAHRATIDAAGTTIAVLGSGVDDSSLYPASHRTLANTVVSTGGAVISEYCPGTRPNAPQFPERNRIIVGLSSMIIVVEAAQRSGALITANIALHENRDVGVVPGPITSPQSQGTNSLLKEGAVPITCEQDILDTLETEFLSLKNDTNQLQDKILSCITSSPLTIDEIIKHSTLPPHTVTSTLAILESKGTVRDVGGGKYVNVNGNTHAHLGKEEKISNR